MLENIKSTTWRKALFMILGNVVMSLGIALFKLSGMGCDPFNGMNMQLSTLVLLSYADLQAIVNIMLFVVQIIWARHMIGLGTVFNALMTGYIVTFFYTRLCPVLTFNSLGMQTVLMLAGIIVCSLGLSFYQTSATGVAPFDSLPFVWERLLPRWPFFLRRIITDGTAAIVCLVTGGLSGGTLGIGTLLCAFALGPLIQLFNRSFVEKLVGNPGDASQKSVPEEQT